MELMICSISNNNNSIQAEFRLIPPRYVYVIQLYGGFIVSHLLADSDEHGTEVQCAAAVTPVTDWRYYSQ